MTVSGRPLVTGPARSPVRLAALLKASGSGVEETFPPSCVSSCVSLSSCGLPPPTHPPHHPVVVALSQREGGSLLPAPPMAHQLLLFSNRLQQEGRAHAVPRGGEDHRGGDQEQRADCGGGEVESRISFTHFEQNKKVKPPLTSMLLCCPLQESGRHCVQPER